MANNLRIIYKNIIDGATITGSSTATASTVAANLKSGIKSLVWRTASSSTTSVKAYIIASFSSTTLAGVILAFTNLSYLATVRVYGYTGTTPTHTGSVDSPTVSIAGATLVFDSGDILSNPYQNIGYSDWGTGSYAERKLYSRVWLSDAHAQIACTSIVVEITDSNNLNQYVEVSKLIVGKQWSPTYNTSYGLSAGTTDMSTSERSEAGDLLVTRGKMYNSLAFDLKWMEKTDRIELNNLIKTNGIQKPLFVSLFPNNSDDWEKEQLYQIYGYQSKLNSLVHPMFSMYSSQLEIEEI
jgi:hypothetical protein